MIQQNLQQAITWFSNVETSIKHSLATLLLQDLNPEKYLQKLPTREECTAYLKNKTNVKIITSLSNLKSAILQSTYEYNYTLDFDIIQYLESLTVLHIYDSSSYINLRSLNNLHDLQILDFHSCDGLSAFLKLQNNQSLLSITLNDCDKFFFTYLINFPKLQSLSIFDSHSVSLKTKQHYNFLKEINIINCTNATIEIDFSQYPYLTNLTIQETTGSITFKNTSEARNLTFANIQQLGKTPQIQEIIKDPQEKQFELC